MRNIKRNTDTIPPQKKVEMTSPNGERENLNTFKVVSMDGKIYSAQTDRFPITFSLGSEYILLMYDADTDAILVEPLITRTQEELLVKQIKLHTHLINRGHKPRTQASGNEYPDS